MDLLKSAIVEGLSPIVDNNPYRSDANHKYHSIHLKESIATLCPEKTPQVDDLYTFIPAIYV